MKAYTYMCSYLVQDKCKEIICPNLEEIVQIQHILMIKFNQPFKGYFWSFLMFWKYFWDESLYREN